MEKIKLKKEIKIFGKDLWRIFAYFIIYSFLGFVIETLYALINFGVLESRKSFLYGPFCSIYGVGAVLIILCLKHKFFKNNIKLFWGGVITGSLVEYFISLFGEMILNVKWWDYSDKFLNINGRICLTYSVIWGFIGIILLKVINPVIDKFIDFSRKKINNKVLKCSTLTIIILLFINCTVSAYAIKVYLIRSIVEKNISVNNRIEIEEIYNEIYNNEEKSKFINTFFGDEKMVKTYPNLTITLNDKRLVRVRSYYPEIQPYYYKFNINK